MVRQLEPASYGHVLRMVKHESHADGAVIEIDPAGRLMAPPLTFIDPQNSPLPTSLAPQHRGAQLRYFDIGTGPESILLLHAVTGCVEMWATVAAELASRGYRVVGFDRRGHGDTLVIDPDDTATTVDDVVHLMDHLGLPRVHVVGTALGGRVANELALAHPERVLTMTVACGMSGLSDDEMLKMGFDRTLPGEVAALSPAAREIGPAYHSINRPGVAMWEELERFATAARSRVHRIQPPMVAFSPGILATIDVPTLILTGDSDPYAPATLCRAIAACYPRAGFVMVPEAGHSVFWERPDLFTNVVLAFVNDPVSVIGASATG